MRKTVSTICLTFLLLLLSSGENFAQLKLTADESPWGMFDAGTFRCTETTITSVADGIKTSSSQTTETTLVSIDKDGVTLKEVETVNLNNKTVKKDQQIKRLDFWQEPIQDGTVIKTGKSAKLMIDKKAVSCEVRIYEQMVPGGKQTTTVWWSPYYYPYVLRKERVLRSVPQNADGTPVKTEGAIISQVVMVVKEIGGSRSKRTYKRQTNETAGNVIKRTDTLCTSNIPGAVQFSSTVEYSNGKEIRSSKTRLINYSWTSTRD